MSWSVFQLGACVLEPPERSLLTKIASTITIRIGNAALLKNRLAEISNTSPGSCF